MEPLVVWTLQAQNNFIRYSRFPQEIIWFVGSNGSTGNIGRTSSTRTFSKTHFLSKWKHVSIQAFSISNISAYHPRYGYGQILPVVAVYGHFKKLVTIYGKKLHR